MKIHLHVLFLLLAQSIFSQDPCKIGVNETPYQSGPIKQVLSTSGAFLKNGTGYSAYNYEKDGNDISLIYTGGLWIGGVKQNGEAVFSGATYVFSNKDSDWAPGPIHDTNNPPGECDKWDKTFSVSRQEILDAIALMYNPDGTVNSNLCDQLPLSILGWPGSQNPHFAAIHGTNLDYTSAPFFDNNTDAYYDPCDGDLPIFETRKFSVNNLEDLKATFPDRLSLNIINDERGLQKLSFGNKVGMEVYQYTFDYHTEDSLEQTTFQMFKTIYQGLDTLYNLYFSLWFDPDLGCYKDDYIGTASEQNMMYFYNVDAVDGQPGNSCDGLATFGEEIPVLGIAYLDGYDYFNDINIPSFRIEPGLTSSIYLNNCSIPPINPLACDPMGQDVVFYERMQGKWTGGVPITRGGTGYNPASVDSTKFVFNDNPNDPNGWSMCTSGLAPQDFRVLMNTGGGAIGTGHIDEVIAAIHTVSNVAHPCPDIHPLIDVNQAALNLQKRNWRRSDFTSSVEDDHSSPLPWNFKYADNAIQLQAETERLKCNISDLDGKSIGSFNLQPGQNFVYRLDNVGIKMVLVTVRSQNHLKSYKVITK